MLFSLFKLRHKNKNKFHFISIYHTFSRSGKLLGKFQELFQEMKTLSFSAFIPFWRNITYRWISLELISWNSTQKENFVVAYLFPPEHMKLGIFMAQSCSDLSKQCTYQNLLLSWHSQCRGRIRCLSSFLSQGISQACIPGRFVLQRWSI